MNSLKNLFDWLLPASLRRRPEPDADRNTALLARLKDNDAVYRCLMDHAHVQFPSSVAGG